MLRSVLSLALSLLLLVTSHSLAQARGASGAVDRMVICTGSEAVLVYIDADGKPTQAPHFCPDCALHGLAMLAVGPFDLGHAPVFSHHAVPSWQAVWPVLRLRGPMARAPPALT